MAVRRHSRPRRTSIQPSIDEIPYVRLHVTLFTSPSKLSPAYFNLPADQEAPTTVLTTLHAEDEAEPGSGAAGKSEFFTVSIQRAVTNPRTSGTEYLYKIFSPMPVDAALLSKLLGVEVPETITGRRARLTRSPIRGPPRGLQLVPHPNCRVLRSRTRFSGTGFTTLRVSRASSLLWRRAR